MMGLLMKLNAVLAVAIASLFISIQAQAQTFQDTSGGPHLWSDTTNWSGGTVPNSNTAAVIIQPATANLLIDLDQNATVRTLTINKPPAVFSTTITTTGSTLTFDGATPTLTHPNVAGSG